MKEGDSTADLKRTLPGFHPHWQRRLWPAAPASCGMAASMFVLAVFSILRSAGTSLLTGQPQNMPNVSIDTLEQ